MANIIAQAGANIPASPLAFYVRTNFFFYFNSQLGITGMSWLCGAAPGVTGTYGDIAFQFNILFKSTFLPLIGVGAQYLGCKVSPLNVTPSPMPGIATDTDAGTGTDGPAPTQASVLTNYTTAISAPYARGRQYFPFVRLDYISLTTSGLTATGRNAFEILAAQFLATNAVTLTSGNLSMTPGLISGGRPFRQFTNYTVRGFLATQKRRSAYNKTNAGVIS